MVVVLGIIVSEEAGVEGRRESKLTKIVSGALFSILVLMVEI
jgi:hypothetical protein